MYASNSRFFSASIWSAVAIGMTLAMIAALTPIDITFGIPFAAITLFLAHTDIERFELPDLANLALFALGMGWVFVTSHAWSEMSDALLRAAVSGAFLVIVREFYRRARQVQGLGLGDVKLMAAAAVWLTWTQLPYALLLASCAGVFVAVCFISRRGDIAVNQLALPFGAFLAPAAWLVWFAGRLDLL